MLRLSHTRDAPELITGAGMAVDVANLRRLGYNAPSCVAKYSPPSFPSHLPSLAEPKIFFFVRGSASAYWKVSAYVIWVLGLEISVGRQVL